MSPRCAVHPEAVARASPCRRCGNFACDGCFGHPSSELCADCAIAEGQHVSDFAIDPRMRARRQWIRRHPRTAGALYLGLGTVLVALNVFLIVAMERYYVMLFPMGGVIMGLGAGFLVTGRAAVGADLRGQPWWYWAITGPLAIGGLLAGIGLNFLM